MLKEWAEAHEVSPFGLEIDMSAGDKNRDKPLEAFDSLAYSLRPLRIMEIFDSMAAYYLNPNRKDKITIATINGWILNLSPKNRNPIFYRFSNFCVTV